MTRPPRKKSRQKDLENAELGKFSTWNGVSFSSSRDRRMKRYPNRKGSLFGHLEISTSSYLERWEYERSEVSRFYMLEYVQLWRLGSARIEVI